MRRARVTMAFAILSAAVLAANAAFGEYHPIQGRFLQRDAEGYADGMNLYEYERSSPVNGLDPKGTRVYFEKQHKAQPGVTEDTITMYVLLRYSVAQDGSEKTIDGNELRKIAATHKALVEDAVNSANYVYREGATAWKVRAKVIITTEKFYPLEDYQKKWRAILGTKEATNEVANYKLHQKHGAFTYVEITDRRLDAYHVGLVPGYDPKWRNMTFRDILAHELIGHGMNNSDEEDRGRLTWRTTLEKELGTKVPADSIMVLDASPLKRFYQRHWEAAFQDKSNIPGQKIIVDQTSYLDVSDPWFDESPAYNQDIKEASFRMLQGIIRSAQEGR